jgi:hypothetical protein
MVGNKIDTLIKNFGLPDAIESSYNYGILFTAGQAAVVFKYDRINKIVYLTQDCVILGVFDIENQKE